MLKVRQIRAGTQGRPSTLDLPEESLPPKQRRAEPRASIRRGRGRIAVNSAGHARELFVREPRGKGEAVHVRHRCA